MNFRLSSDLEAAPFIACVLAAGEVQLRMAARRLNARSTPRLGRREAVEVFVPCAADFGLTAAEVGAWGRLRATGLSDRDAADVVKAARRDRSDKARP